VDAAADLATVDLNALLYKYETDIACAIKEKFQDALTVPAGVMPADHDSSTCNSAYWEAKAAARKAAVDRYQWNPETGMYHDYNTVTNQQTPFRSVTTFYPLWSGLASEEQAKQLIEGMLPQFEHVGGMVSTLPLPGSSWLPRQWDYPYGWAPHQILVWDGLRRYGYTDHAHRVAYRWLYLLTKTFADFNGRMTERYDVVQKSEAAVTDGTEYGNQGSKFDGVNIEGYVVFSLRMREFEADFCLHRFGWTNSSYQYGLKIIGEKLTAALKAGLAWEDIEGASD
jgi:alpha,alpha-trehalase